MAYGTRTANGIGNFVSGPAAFNSTGQLYELHTGTADFAAQDANFTGVGIVATPGSRIQGDLTLRVPTPDKNNPLGIIKYPTILSMYKGAKLFFEVDWSDFLNAALADTISGLPIWTVPAGLTGDYPFYTDTQTTIMLTGNVPEQLYTVKVTITTLNGTTGVFEFDVRVIDTRLG